MKRGQGRSRMSKMVMHFCSRLFKFQLDYRPTNRQTNTQTSGLVELRFKAKKLKNKYNKIYNRDHMNNRVKIRYQAALL